jgi:hypothetical protein
MLLPNLPNLLSLALPILPILAKDFFTRPKTTYETPDTFAGQGNLGKTLIDNLLKSLTAQYGGEGTRPATFRGAESVRNFRPRESVGAAPGTTAFATPNLGPLANAIQSSMQRQTADREGREPALVEPALQTRASEWGPKAGFAAEERVTPEDKVVRDILDQLDGKRNLRENE